MKLTKLSFVAVVAVVLALGACNGNSSTSPSPVQSPPTARYLSTVLVEYTSMQDLLCNPNPSDPSTWVGCVGFNVKLYDPLHPSRGSCSTGQGSFNSLCPQMMSGVRKIGPFT